MSLRVWSACLLATLLLLGGCAHHAPGTDGQNRPQAWLEPGVKVTLPPPGLTPAFDRQQLLTGTFDGKEQSLLVMLSVDQHRLSLAGLSSLGIRLFLLTYDQNGLHTEQSIVVPQLPPASQVLADIMLSHWPLAAWQSQLPTGWTLVDKGDQRELRDPNGRLITEVHYRQTGALREPVALTQHVFNYHLTIQPLSD